MIHFFVHGRPSPGGSKRYVGHSKAGRAILIDMGGAHTKSWREAVATCAKYFMGFGEPYEGALTLKIVFYMKRPGSHYNRLGLREDAPQWHTNAPDATKLVRSTEDALKGIVWRDDCLVVEQYVEKRYVQSDTYEDQQTGAMIYVLRHPSNNAVKAEAKRTVRSAKAKVARAKRKAKP
jgi:Holliday junction resolvase RusA-like endonuclease